jgi:hypothetical protein
MSPTHSNKLGVRYRYYVSHAILQQRKDEAGSITRVPAPEIETLVLDGVRKHLSSTGKAEYPTAITDRNLIERHVDSVIVKPQALEVLPFISRWNMIFGRDNYSTRAAIGGAASVDFDSEQRRGLGVIRSGSSVRKTLAEFRSPLRKLAAPRCCREPSR